MERDVVHAFTLRMNVFLQPKRQRDEQHAYDYGISADYPDQRQRTRTRSQHHADTKQHRYYAAQNQEPLVVDLLAQLDRGYDLKYPGRDRPAAMKNRSTSALRPGIRNPAAMPSRPTIASHQPGFDLPWRANQPGGKKNILVGAAVEL
jgi:hypothetical protein